MGRCYPIWSAFEKCLVGVCRPGSRVHGGGSFLVSHIECIPLAYLTFFPHNCSHDYQATAPHFKECMDFRDDYVECLHHRKEVGVAFFAALCPRRESFHPFLTRPLNVNVKEKILMSQGHVILAIIPSLSPSISLLARVITHPHYCLPLPLHPFLPFLSSSSLIKKQYARVQAIEKQRVLMESGQGEEAGGHGGGGGH